MITQENLLMLRKHKCHRKIDNININNLSLIKKIFSEKVKE